MADAFIPVQGTGAILIEEESMEAEKSSAKALLAVILSFIFIIAVAFVFSAFIWKKALPTTKEVYDASLPGQPTMPRFSLTPLTSDTDGDYEDYTDNNVATVVTSPIHKKVCENDDCRHVRQFIEAVVDTDRDPCDNFFKFACGKNQQVLPNVFLDEFGRDLGEAALWTSIEEILEKARIPPSGRTAFQKAAALYKHCLEANPNTSAEAARDFLMAHQMDMRKNMSFNPLDVMMKFFFKIDIPLLFKLEPIAVGANLLAFRTEEEAPLELQYLGPRDILPDVYSEDIDDSVVRIITELEKKFASQRTVSKKPNASVKAIEFRKVGLGDDELSKEWNEALQRYTPPALQNRTVYVTEADLRFFRRLFGKQSDVSKNEMRVFFAWRSVLYLHKILGSSFNCLAITTRELPDAVAAGAQFIPHYEERMSAINEMKEGITSEISKTLQTSSWIDDKTREGALQKIAMVTFRFGLAPKLNSSKKVDQFYENLSDLHGPYVRDILSIHEFKTQRCWKGVEEGYSDYFRDMVTTLNPYQTNGFYVAGANFVQLNVPLLLSPHFNLGGPPEVNYGALGHTVMHEMMHGFDLNGRKYDGKGDMSPWFTKKSAEEFAVLERCYVERIERAPKSRTYADYPWEYQADILGSRSLLRAYLKAAKRSNVHLGNVEGLTADQIFYVTSCLHWCTDLLYSETLSGHPPPDERCNLPLMNSVHFSKTFSCPDGSLMNPPQKCPFW
ncbi:neprilysin-21-like [Ornithodoros turicata]|uniref:neprilysin-21-like n=1 Tax=Ornithodoros turicata TaxID=34597 RepID=UPI003138C2B0